MAMAFFLDFLQDGKEPAKTVGMMVVGFVEHRFVGALVIPV